MDWIKSVFRYTPLEKELLSDNSQNSLYERYNQIIDVDGTKAYAVVAPPPNAKKIPRLPPIVVIHGTGGCMFEFTYLVQMLNRVTEVIVIDLPGHGRSPIPPNTDAYSADGIVLYLSKAIERLSNPELPVILLGHSYGTAHALRLALGPLKSRCSGVICVCPPFGGLVSGLEKTISGHIPVVVYDSIIRSRDRVGGLHSPAVNRMVAPSADDRARRDQLRASLQADSYAVLQTTAGSRVFNELQDEGIPECPVLIIATAQDVICPPIKSEQMLNYFKSSNDRVKLELVNGAGHGVILEKPEVLAGIISTFLKDYVDERLSMSWQLSYLASLDNKWSLKNEKKWKEVTPVGERVGNSVLKGMKVPREGDETHGPSALEEAHPEIAAIIDISREAPPYDPSIFKRIKYHKFPTVSKIPPTKTEVQGFIELVDRIKATELASGGLIGVHCHYGFNRTGFFICSYLIERNEYNVADALKAYRDSRPPGIKHQHFINELYVRNSS